MSNTERLDALQKEEQELLLSLASVRAAIDVLVKGVLRGAPVDESLGPPLDNMRIRDAINAHLRWRRDRGMDPITLGELLTELSRHNVVSFRNEPMSAMRHPWKSMCNVLGSPDNQILWNIHRHNDDHFTRLDTIELAAKNKPQK